MDTSGSIKIALGQDAEGQTYETNHSFFDYILTSSDDSNCKDPSTTDMFSIPHSNSYIDLDGDCMPDIFLTRQYTDSNGVTQFYYEIYSQQVVNGE